MFSDEIFAIVDVNAVSAKLVIVSYQLGLIAAGRLWYPRASMSKTQDPRFRHLPLPTPNLCLCHLVFGKIVPFPRSKLSIPSAGDEST